MDKSRDEELVHQSLDDEDENAFEILYHRYEVPLLNFFYRRVRDWETAQDLVQETFIRVHAHLGTLRDRKKFSSWLFSIACLLYTSPSPRDRTRSRMPSSA